MTSQKAEIKACMCHWLAELADDALCQHGFARRKNRLMYVRKTENGTQKINVAIEHHPSDRPDAAAAVCPAFTVSMEDVNELVCQMVAGQLQLGGDFATTLWGPIEWTCPEGRGARWHLFQPDSVPGIAQAIVEYLRGWTIPFLNRYRTTADLASAPTEGDGRAANTQEEVLRVVAAKVLCGSRDEAWTMLDHWFGKPGPRRRYRSVFEYLEALAD